MPNALLIYLQDHLAGSEFAVSLLSDLAKQTSHQRLAEFSQTLLTEIESDRIVLQNLIEEQQGSTNTLKNTLAWFTQKLGQFKLNLDETHGQFEALELLSLGITGKLALWTALEKVPGMITHLHPTHLMNLQSRARDQFTQVEQFRLQLAVAALNES
ncbi:MAG: hypothetical protein SFX18_14700 [Pirellulales bacterium]|nr:hypothetical protein [Pirellulales bacterium]